VGPDASIHFLQRTVGNRATARMLRMPADSEVLAQKTDDVRTDIDDCPTNAKDVIRERTATARAWLVYSIRQLDTVLADPSKADADIHRLLRLHFHIGQGKRAGQAFPDTLRVRGTFAKLLNAFNKTIPFECEKKCKKGRSAYVRKWWLFGWHQGVIHVCPLFFGRGYWGQSVDIIHEIGHKYVDLDDKAYRGNAKYANLTTSDAMNNADSYAHFAGDI
jgi:Lysine-specific metallo-endopeptidase